MEKVLKPYVKNIYSFINYIVLIYLIIKSITMPITVDEAYTFLNYVYVKDLFNLSIANNHLLNTLLISLTTTLSNYEFFIRIPNIIFAFLYFYLANKLIISSKNSFFAFCTFLMFPYVLEFFAHARGYGIVFTLNFCGLYYFINNSRNKLKNYVVTSLFFYLGAISLSYNLIAISTLFIFFVQKNKSILKNKMFLIYNLAIFTFSIPLIRSTIATTANDKPLYGLPENVDFIYFIKYFFGYALLIDLRIASGYFLISFFLFCLLLKKSLNQESEFKILFCILNLQLFLIPLILNKPLPLLRLLIPFVPFLIFWIYYFFEDLTLNNRIKSLSANTILCLLLVNSVSSFNIFYSSVWSSLSRKQLQLKALSEDSCEYLIDGGGGIVFEYYMLINNILC